MYATLLPHSYYPPRFDSARQARVQCRKFACETGPCAYLVLSKREQTEIWNELLNIGSANTVSIFLQHKGLFGVFFGQAHINCKVHVGEKYKVTRKFQIYESHDTAHCVYICASQPDFRKIIDFC